VDLEQSILQANILIIDDEPANVRLLEKILQRHGYTGVRSTSDSREVAILCEQTRFDAFLLDIRMPHLDGFEIMALLKEKFDSDYLPVLMLTAQSDMETRLNALGLGAKDFLTKPFDRVEALIRIHNLLEVRLMHNRIRDQNRILEEQVQARTAELYQTRQEVIRRLGLAAEYRDNETGNHIIRMSKYAQIIALAHGLPAQEAEIILNAAPMHDIGKIGIPDRILLKPGKLDEHEWRSMQSHVDIGAAILSGSDSGLMATARRIALHHHEKWDGTGYPAGLRGEDISIEGRICALADVFDALTSERPYKVAWSVQKALDLLDEETGKHFDPRLVPLVRKRLPEILAVKAEYADAVSTYEPVNQEQINSDIDYRQAFAWAVQLTAQADYQSLTHGFLGLLEKLPWVNHAAAYEIYGDNSRRTGEAASIGEQLIRRFPLDFTALAQDEDAELLLEINATLGMEPSKADGDGFFRQVIASVRDVCGPDRALFLSGKFDAPALALLSDLIALYRNQVAMHDSKERDLLTKLPNRQSFDARLLQVCEHFRHYPVADRQQSKSSWIAMLDIDHFKRINDTFGHLYGDEVLLIFSQQMEKHFRYNDFLFRFGGEEFVVILNLVNQDDAEAVFERFRKAIAGHVFPTVGRVTVSIGVAHIDSAIMPTTLLDRADKALYYAKDNGRNRLSLYEKIAESMLDSDGGEAELF
jgi:putative two-component system response regulator